MPRDWRGSLTGSLHFPYRRLILAISGEATTLSWEPSSNGIRILRYLFAEYVFDADRRELHRGPMVVSVTPQVFDLLEYLIRNRERVVSKCRYSSAAHESGVGPKRPTRHVRKMSGWGPSGLDILNLSASVCDPLQTKVVHRKQSSIAFNPNFGFAESVENAFDIFGIKFLTVADLIQFSESNPAVLLTDFDGSPDDFRNVHVILTTSSTNGEKTGSRRIHKCT